MTQNKYSFLKKEKIKIFEPFEEISIDFLNQFSIDLKKNKKTFKSPELFYLTLFCSKKNILNFKKKMKDNYFRVGRGLVFHVCPNNVPINFIFSFIFGLLSGNTNIIKVPIKKSEEKEIILKCIRKVFSYKKFSKLKNTNFFIEYDHREKKDLTKLISLNSDARIVWGGDNTINEFKEIKTKPRCIDVNFADRYSLSIINTKKIKNLSIQKLNILARKFFYDIFTMNQMACNSPHFIFWIGTIDKKTQKYFLKKISQIAKKKFKFDDVHIMRKYNNLVDRLMNIRQINNINLYQNFLYVVDIDKTVSNIEDIRGESGTIFQVNIKKIDDISKYINKKCQTITYYGFEKEKFKLLIKNNNLLGADRIVEIGRAFNFDLIWDGVDTVKTLTRIINFN